MKPIVLGLLSFYQKALSPYAGARCRFVPSCSTYMMEAVQKYGVARGLRRGVKRLLRCHPWGGHGFDPVEPLKLGEIHSHE